MGPLLGSPSPAETSDQSACILWLRHSGYAAPTATAGEEKAGGSLTGSYLSQCGCRRTRRGSWGRVSPKTATVPSCSSGTGRPLHPSAGGVYLPPLNPASPEPCLVPEMWRKQPYANSRPARSDPESNGPETFRCQKDQAATADAVWKDGDAQPAPSWGGRHGSEDPPPCTTRACNHCMEVVCPAEPSPDWRIMRNKTWAGAGLLYIKRERGVCP